MIKDIVVNLGLGDRDPASEFAISLAETVDAHVLGVAFAYEPVIPGSVMGGIPPEFIEAQRTESDNKARAAIERFEAAAKRSSLSFETRVVTASISSAAEQLGRIARRFDLAVVGQPERETGMPEEVVDEGVLFESGRPVVFVPYIFKGPAKLDRVMVCWDGGRAATRAIADALPLMQKAKQVEVVIVATGRPKSDEVPGADLGQHLARHGLKVEVKRITSPDIDVPSTILSYAADSSADLIVMGGYGHSRLREFVLGGVTRGLLESMTVPVLMSH
ncbi:universal stress protein [Pseudolabrys taiwanensis]|uniref:Universal stress protein n=1 Tax=Pseudolabrys taiwanensis TaxID=331696 RepID=A0A345ZVP6_9HYPH|nr:universal stress protein [Pseudolabrys taiwanensis]AXK80993.1 universal stress protein [Pseudolabrys taiwanensis]